MAHAMHIIDIYNSDLKPSSDPSGEPVFSKLGSNHVFDEFRMLDLKRQMQTGFARHALTPPARTEPPRVVDLGLDGFDRCSHTS